MAVKPHRAIVSAAVVALCLSAIAGNALDQLDFAVQGGDKKLEGTLRAASGLLAAKAAKGTGVLDYLTDARAEYGKLIAALYAKGHYQPVIHVLVDGVEAAEIAPLESPTAIGRIVVTVDPGPQFTFSKAEIAPQAYQTVLPTGFAAGQVAESGMIKGAVQAGIDRWRVLGYAKAAVSGQELVADHANATLSADIAIAQGPVLRFGPLTVNGAQKMRVGRVRAIAGLPVGERFNADELARSAERLRRSGVFTSVSLTEDDFITAPDILGITADLVEARQHRYTFGAEIASADGAKISGSWLHRNLAGGGERLEITGEIAGLGAQTGGNDYSLGVTLDRPAAPWPDTELNLAAGISQVNEVDTTANIASVSAGFTQYFGPTLTGTTALRFSATDGTDAAGDYSYRSFELPVGITWDRRDSKTDPTKLFYISAEGKPFYGFGSTDNGLRLTFDARAYKGVADNRVVFAARVQGGAVIGADPLQTPRADLFYSGGGGTVRGQAYQSLGVTVNDAGTDVRIGGNQFLAGSLETRVKVTDTIGIVGFVDMGLVGLQGGDSDWQGGAGIGLRYATGVGPVRLDLAAPINGGQGIQVYVGLGQSF